MVPNLRITIRAVNTSITFLILGFLSACGGGGSSDSGTSSAISTPSTTVVLSPAASVVTGDTAGPVPTQSIHVVINNPPTSGFYYQASAQRTAIQSVSSQLSASTEGNITLNFWSPRALGAGTYTDSVQFRLCNDSQCAQPIPGASATVGVTYTVTGSATPLTTFNASAISNTQLALRSTDAMGAIVTIGLNVFDIPPQGLHIRYVEQTLAGSPKLVSAISFRQTGNVTGEIAVQLVAPTSLSALTYTEDLQVSLCFDAACLRTVAGSPITIPLNYKIYASEGREFATTDLNINAASAAWDAVSQRLYVLRVAQSGTSIVAVNPVSGDLGASVAVPNESSSIVVSDDGQFAYVNSTYGQAVYRYRLPTLTADAVIHLGGVLQANQIAVAPGASRTLAIVQYSSGVANSIAIYDDLVKRANNGTAAAAIVWGANASRLYSLDTDNQILKSWAVSSTGLGLLMTSQLNNSLNVTGPLTYQNGLIYSRYGSIFDLASQSFLQPIPDGCCGLISIDVGLDRAYKFEGNILESKVISTRKNLSTALLASQISSSSTPPIRWGANGLALLTSDGHLILLTGDFVAL